MKNKEFNEKTLKSLAVSAYLLTTVIILSLNRIAVNTFLDILNKKMRCIF